MTPFDPSSAAGSDSGLFGLPHSADEARVHVIPLPFDATTSYRTGAALGPAAILEASRQIDLFDTEFGKPYEAGIYLLEEDSRIAGLNSEARKQVELLREDEENEELAEAANEPCRKLDEYAQETAEAILAAGKLPVGLGGDHATAFGTIAACAERFPGLGILHFDAHADLRIAFEGLERSHASIMHNVLANFEVAKLVQVGVRDLCEEEHCAIRGSDGLIEAVFDRDWASVKLSGGDLGTLVRETISKLPDEVYVSFDVDGLDPSLCPNTGTPVPGGLGWHEAMLWLNELARSKKRIVGLDLCEVNPGPEGGSSLDSIVGARLLYRLIGAALAES